MRITGFYLAALLGGLAAAQVPLEQEPRHHLEFANDALRVISPQIPPGDTTLEHIHTHDEATVCIQGSQTRGKPHDGEWGNPGRVCVPGTVGLVEYTGKPRSHTVQNLGSQTYHLLLVENLRDSGWKENQPLTTPGLKIARENRSFRVYDADLSGSGVPEHVHEVPTVVILVSGAAMTADKHLDQPGTWALVPAGTPHRVATHGEAKVLEIEVR